MKAVDSSVAIAAFASWHEFHAEARRILAEKPSIVAHAAIETYSVLTRLPEPQRVAPGLVVEFLAANFSGPPLVLSAKVAKMIPARLAELEVAGGATYDGLIAFTAASHRATLVSLDRRAISTYERCGVEYEMAE